MGGNVQDLCDLLCSKFDRHDDVPNLEYCCSSGWIGSRKTVLTTYTPEMLFQSVLVANVLYDSIPCPIYLVPRYQMYTSETMF